MQPVGKNGGFSQRPFLFSEWRGMAFQLWGFKGVGPELLTFEG
jgi:hypothetical protein